MVVGKLFRNRPWSLSKPAVKIAINNLKEHFGNSRNGLQRSVKEIVRLGFVQFWNCSLCYPYGFEIAQVASLIARPNNLGTCSLETVHYAIRTVSELFKVAKLFGLANKLGTWTVSRFLGYQNVHSRLSAEHFMTQRSLRLSRLDAIKLTN